MTGHVLVLLWPSRLPRGNIYADLGFFPERFTVLDGDSERSLHRLNVTSPRALVLDPHGCASSGPLAALVRERFPDVIQGVGACRRQALALLGPHQTATEGAA